MSIEERIGIRTSMTLGLPTGVLAVGLVLLFPAWLTGEGLFTMAFMSTNDFAILRLLICFPGALWFAGQRLGNDIKLGKNGPLTILKYSITVNVIIWTVFIVIHWLTNGELDLVFGLYFPIGLAIISILFTPLTIGFIIYWTTRKEIERRFASTQHKL